MLTDVLKKIISDSFVLYFKAHSYHWNVEGPDFKQYHDFLGDYYQDVFDSIDVYAELVRTLDQYAPPSLKSILDTTGMVESDTVPSAVAMLSTIKQNNDQFLATLVSACDMAEKTGEMGIANYLQDRIQAHEKHAWMLRAITK